MYPPGHVGIALALYAPIGLVLLIRGRVRLAVIGTCLVAGLTMLPDVDKWLPWFVHRGATHTVWFALGVGASVGAIAATIAEYRYRSGSATLRLGAFGLCVGALAVVAHLLGDVITPMGIRPYAPVSDASYTYSLVFASDPTTNARLFAVGCVATLTQLLLGVGLAPAAPGRSAVRGASDAVGGYVRSVVRPPGDARASPADTSTGPSRPPGPLRETDD